MKKLTLVGMTMVATAGAALAQATPFDPTAGVTAFTNELGAKLNQIFPFAITIMLVPLGYRIVIRLMRRGMKV